MTIFRIRYAETVCYLTLHLWIAYCSQVSTDIIWPCSVTATWENYQIFFNIIINMTRRIVSHSIFYTFIHTPYKPSATFVLKELQFCAVNNPILCHKATQKIYHQSEVFQYKMQTVKDLLKIKCKKEWAQLFPPVHLSISPRHPLNPHCSTDVAKTCGSYPRLSKPLMLFTLVVIKDLVSEWRSHRLWSINGSLGDGNRVAAEWAFWTDWAPSS